MWTYALALDAAQKAEQRERAGGVEMRVIRGRRKKKSTRLEQRRKRGTDGPE